MGVRGRAGALGAENNSLVLGDKKLTLRLSTRPHSSTFGSPRMGHHVSSPKGREGLPT